MGVSELNFTASEVLCNSGSSLQPKCAWCQHVAAVCCRPCVYVARSEHQCPIGGCACRWYGNTTPPSQCFMERKTHRESWKGEESVKDRFTLPENQMVPFLTGEYGQQQAEHDISAKVLAPFCCLPGCLCAVLCCHLHA